MVSRKAFRNLAKDIEINIAVGLMDRVMSTVNLIFAEEKDLDIIRSRLLQEIAKYVAPFLLEDVSISIRKFIVIVRKEEEELLDLNGEEGDSEEESSGEDEEDLIKPDSRGPSSPIAPASSLKEALDIVYLC